MALTFDTTIRDEVCRRVYGAAYASISTTKQASVDRCGAEALQLVEQYGKWFEVVEAPANLDEWGFWLSAEAAALASIFGNPKDRDAHREEADRAMMRALQTFTRLEWDRAADGATDESRVNYTQSIRRYIIGNLVRRSPPKYVPVEQIDHAVYWAVSTLWNSRFWSFRRRDNVLLTIGTDQSVTPTWDTRFTVTPDDVMDKIATRNLYYTGTGVSGILCMVDADGLADYRANYTTTGQPEYYRMDRRGTQTFYHFAPAPDQEYTVRGSVYVKLPSGIGDEAATSENAFKFFPEEMQTTIRDFALRKVLVNIGDAKAEEFRREMESEIERLWTVYDDPGDGDMDMGTVRDVYHDTQYQRGENAIGGQL